MLNRFPQDSRLPRKRCRDSFRARRCYGAYPNQYFAVSSAIDRGIPLMQQNHTEIARSFSGLATALTKDDDDVKRSRVVAV